MTNEQLQGALSYIVGYMHFEGTWLNGTIILFQSHDVFLIHSGRILSNLQTIVNDILHV